MVSSRRIGLTQYSLLILMLLVISSVSSPVAAVASPHLKLSQDDYQGIKPSQLSVSRLDKTFDYQMDVVFLGFGPDRIDENLMLKELPKWYAPIDRYDYFFGKKSPYDVNYTISYNFRYIQDANKVRDDFFSMATLADEPFFSVYNNDTYYIPSSKAEDYLQQYVTEDRPTMFFLDLYTINPSKYHEHLYNASTPDMDGGSFARLYGSQYQIAGGGESSRLLWLDLSVGGSDYRDDPAYGLAGVNDTLIPNVWDPSYVGNTSAISEDMVTYLQTAIELRYLPSYIYTPATAYEEITFQMLLIDVDPSGYDFMSEIDLDYITSRYSQLDPNIKWTASVEEYDWENDAGLAKAISDAGSYYTNPNDQFYNTYASDFILSYLNNNYKNYVDESTKDRLVVPIFLFAFEGRRAFDYFLGVANNANSEFSYVVAMSNVFYATDGYKLYYDNLYSENDTVIAASGNDVVGYNLGAYTEYAQTTISSDTALDLHIMDQTNYEKYVANQPYDDIYTMMAFTGQHNVEFNISIDDNYYWVVENPLSSTASYNMTIDLYVNRQFGFTFVVMHESGHALGLSHPHDGYSWQGNGIVPPDTDYLYWLWDLSYSQMTYAHHYANISQMDVDTYQRGAIPRYYDDLYTQLVQLKKSITTATQVYLPEPLYISLNQSIQALEKIGDGFSNYDSLTNLAESLKQVFVAKAAIDELASLSAQDWSQSISVSFDSNREETVSFLFEIVNTRSQFTNNVTTSSVFEITPLPWADFKLTITYKGEVMSELFGKTWDGDLVVSLEFPSKSTTSDKGGFPFPILGFVMLPLLPIVFRRNTITSHKKS